MFCVVVKAARLLIPFDAFEFEIRKHIGFDVLTKIGWSHENSTDSVLEIELHMVNRRSF